MAGEIYCECGAVLVAEVTQAGVRPPGTDEVIPFRRTTDYVLCGSCMMSYDAPSLITRAETQEIIDGLERLVEAMDADSNQRDL